MTTYKHQSSPQRSPVPYAPNAAPSENLAKAVVAVTEVLGSKTAEVQVTQTLITRGMRALRRAKHGRSPRQPSASRQTLRYKAITLLMVLAWQTPKQSPRRPPRQPAYQHHRRQPLWPSTSQSARRPARQWFTRQVTCSRTPDPTHQTAHQPLHKDVKNC